MTHPSWTEPIRLHLYTVSSMRVEAFHRHEGEEGEEEEEEEEAERKKEERRVPSRQPPLRPKNGHRKKTFRDSDERRPFLSWPIPASRESASGKRMLFLAAAEAASEKRMLLPLPLRGSGRKRRFPRAGHSTEPENAFAILIRAPLFDLFEDFLTCFPIAFRTL
jgi:hypothetical protein